MASELSVNGHKVIGYKNTVSVPLSSGFSSDSYVYYYVANNICFVWGYLIPTNSSYSNRQVCTGLPLAAIQYYYNCGPVTGSEAGRLLYISNSGGTGRLSIYTYTSTNGTYFGFSYPVHPSYNIPTT